MSRPSASLIGAAILYTIGFYGGLPFVRRYGPTIPFSENEYERVHAFSSATGRPTVFWCRFIPFIRGVSSLPAGISRNAQAYFFNLHAVRFGGSSVSVCPISATSRKQTSTRSSAGCTKATLADHCGVVVLAVGAFVVLRARKKKAPTDLAA